MKNIAYLKQNINLFKEISEDSYKEEKILKDEWLRGYYMGRGTAFKIASDILARNFQCPGCGDTDCDASGSCVYPGDDEPIKNYADIRGV